MAASELKPAISYAVAREYARGTRDPGSQKASSRYEELNSLRGRNNQKIDWPDTSRETPTQFLARAGWKAHEIEGGSRDDHEGFFQDLLEKNPWIRRVVEIGFNAGVSSDIFLSSRPDITVHSFDIMWHHYSTYAKMYTDIKYPGRHMLTAGDSAQSVPTYIEEHILVPTKDSLSKGHVTNPMFRTYDLIFIDGDHTYQRAMLDIRNMRFFAGPETIVVIDNVAPHRGCSEQVYRAYRDLWEAGLLYHERHVEVSIKKDGKLLTYHDGFVVCRYRQYGYVDRPGAPDWKTMERRVRLTNISREMARAHNRTELDKLYRQAKEFEKEDGEDPYIEPEYARYRDELGRKSGGWSNPERVRGKGKK
jgi:predicted O-methyltransferase YrrM